ncbi:HPr family phosphocarrier protein [Planctobacterium marinum]|uniref:HPr family phosphocarrier protein n=1 Tax=Planctobacterium marinum TaxID=1631968 RepID=UPI0030C6C5B3
MRIEKELTIINKLGLHARAATELVKLATSFSADILVQKDGKSVSANSVLGLMMLEGSQNKQVKVVCEGDDAEAAMEAIEALFSARFNEDE